MAWLRTAGKYKIEKIPCPYPGDDVSSAPAMGVLHTTEGSWDSALSVFKQHYAPHFLVGPGRIAQLVPLGKMSTALEHPRGTQETNRIAKAQIEVVGFSKEHPYVFDARTMDALASLIAKLKTFAGIPISRPFIDKMPPPPWATTNFSRRKAGKWGKVAGWYGHVEIPNNAHWDPGNLIWSTLMAEANSKLNHVKPKPKIEPPWILVDEKGRTIGTGRLTNPLFIAKVRKEILRRGRATIKARGW